MKFRVSIFLISISYSLIVGSGYYGFGNDYYAAYGLGDLGWGKWFDRLGYIISSMVINNVHIGVYLTSFILAISTLILTKNFLDFKKIESLIFYLFISIILIHTWPIIMSTSNAMKQGLCMSFLFLSIAYLIKNENIISFLFIFLSIFFHKTGIFFFSIYLSLIFIKILKFKIIHFQNSLYFFYGLLLSSLYYFILPEVYHITEEPTRVIGADFRLIFLLLIFLYIVLFTYKSNFLKNNFILYLYMFSFVSSSLLFHGLNWQYERLIMMMIIPYVFAIGIILNKKSVYYIFISLFSSLLFLTIFYGMYASLQ
jgi:hypothetical protein